MTRKRKLVETLLLNDSFFDAAIHAMNNAKQSIFIETYIFNDDRIGNEIIHTLLNAANRGIHVKLLVDGIGSLDFATSIKQKLRHPLIESRMYHPVPWNLSEWRSDHSLKKSALQKFVSLLMRINARNHRKCILIDNRIAIIGSVNICDPHLSRERGGEQWRDTSILIENAEMQNITESFHRAFGTNKISTRIKNAIKPKSVDMIFRLNDTFRRRIRYYHKLVEKIASSEHRIWITNAYFVPDYRILSLLCHSARDGVDVRIILPHESDVFAVSLVSKTFYGMLIEAGVKLFEYKASILHAKVLIMDDDHVIGSSNFNYRSMHHDLEVDVTVSTQHVKHELEAAFQRDMQQSMEITKNDIKKQSIINRLLGQLLLLFRYWL